MRFRPGLILLTVLLLGSISAQAAPSACTSLKAAVAPRSAQALFLPSFPRAADRTLKGTAFLYDNAVAVIALIACGNVKAAARIGDAMLLAQDHDRYFRDGRLRNAYPAGRVEKPAKLTGWWEPGENRWVEDRYQVGSDTGNQAWAMLALLTLHKAGAGTQYLRGAERIAVHVERSFDARAPAGFMGGTFGGEPTPRAEKWKSTEHNADLAAAYRMLGDTTKNARWKKRAGDAENFVTAMWDETCRCFFAGTILDGKTVNRQLALDAQIWPLLAVPGFAKHSGALRTAKEKLKGDDGFAYSSAGKGFWTEGTAQVALLYALTGDRRESGRLLAAVARHRTKDGHYYAADSGGVATGIGNETVAGQRRYFRTPHLAALAWVALAQTGFNPFTSGSSLP